LAGQGARGCVVLALLLVLLLILAEPIPLQNSAGVPTGPNAAHALYGHASANATLTPDPNSFPLSPLFWGTTMSPRSPIFSDQAALFESTPTRVILWPGGSTSEDFDPFYANDSGGLVSSGDHWKESTTSEAQFVHFCESINCTAIMQVPGEIDDPAFAAQILNYTETTLGFDPYAWEIGNEPELWHYWQVPWDNRVPANENTVSITYTQYAEEVTNYTTAMRAIDPHVRIIGLPGTGRPQPDGPGGSWTYLQDWINATILANGPNLTAVAFHDYPAPTGGPLTLASFYAYITSGFGLPARISTARGQIAYDESHYADCAGAGASCNISAFVTEIGSALSHGKYGNDSAGFPGALDLAAEMIQGLTLNVTNIDLFASVLNTTNSWFLPNGTMHPDYLTYADFLSHLGNQVVPISVTSPTVGINTTLFAIATQAPAAGQRTDFLVVNLNTTTATTVTPYLPGVSASDPVEEWSWNGSLTGNYFDHNESAVANTPAPVASYLPGGLPTSITVPAQGMELFEAYPSGGAPVTFHTKGEIPLGTRWFLSVNGSTYTSNGSNLTVFLPSGSYTASTAPIELPLNRTPEYDRHRLIGVVSSPFSVSSGSPENETVNYTGQWFENVTVSPSGSGTVAPSVGWMFSNATINLTATASLGFTFNRWDGFGEGAVNSSNPTIEVTASENGWFDEKALFLGAYPITFHQVGLPLSTSWGVTVAGTTIQTTNGSLLVWEPNGTRGFSPLPVVGFRQVPVNSTFHVEGGGLNVTVHYYPIGRPPTYPVTFTEQGLPVDTGWGVTVAGSAHATSNTSLIVWEPDGTRGFSPFTVSGFRPVPVNSSFHVNGSGLNVSVHYYPTTPPPQYEVTFTEVGLPTGTPWGITVRGDRVTSTTAIIRFEEAAGKYGYQVSGHPGFRDVSPDQGFTVTSGPLVISITFDPLRTSFLVQWNETGLWAPVRWSIVIQATEYNVSEAWFSLALGNGTYSIEVDGPPGFSASPHHETLPVHGEAIRETIRFAEVTFPVRFVARGLPIGARWGVRLSDQVMPNVSTSSTNLSVANGTYTFTVISPTGYYSSPSHGNVSVDANAVNTSLQFAPVGPGPRPGALILGLEALGVAAIALSSAAGIFFLIGFVHRRRRSESGPGDRT
jgi:Divergent InlB B-repeat domain